YLLTHLPSSFIVTPPPALYTLSLHDALPIFTAKYVELQSKVRARFYNELVPVPMRFVHTIDSHLGLLEPLGIDEEDREIRLQLQDRKSTRLNSSHGSISYAVFCLKKKKTNKEPRRGPKERHTTRDVTRRTRATSDSTK